MSYREAAYEHLQNRITELADEAAAARAEVELWKKRAALADQETKSFQQVAVCVLDDAQALAECRARVNTLSKQFAKTVAKLTALREAAERYVENENSPRYWRKLLAAIEASR